ncbi:MAG: outer membrane protein assembly factor BamB family protein [Planctomycetota bacterium]|jgi:outer membrane protein assembly factor BamB
MADRIDLVHAAVLALAIGTCSGQETPAADTTGTDAERAWPQWRGPLGTGAAPHAEPPLTWSETSNVRWKAALPGTGHGTPIVWGDRVFVTTAVTTGDPVEPRPETAPGAHDNVLVHYHYRFLVLAFSRLDGSIVWHRTVKEELPHEGGHRTGTQASASPVTDGEHLLAFFGSRGLFCLDLDGHLQWQRDFGDMQTKHGHGEGSSPALHGNTVVVNWDHEGQSFIVALDKRTGVERWRVRRDEVTSWATPIIVEHGDRAQVIVSGTARLRGYDLATGEVIWECGGLSHNVVASPVATDGLVIAGSSYEKQAMLAIRLEGARGDLTRGENIAWMRRRRTPYVPSPLIYDGWLYFLNHYQGVLSRVEAGTGEEPEGPFRLAVDDVYASPVAAADRVYIVDRGGATLVLSHEPEPSVLARNVLNDSFSASPALVGGELYLRGEEFLYCVAETPGQ